MEIGAGPGLVMGVLDALQAQALPELVFFSEISSFLDDEITEFADNLLGRAVAVAGSAALSLLTLWILVQGYRMATGLSREPAMALVGDAVRAVLVIGIATGAAAGSGSTYRLLADGLGEAVSGIVSGRADAGPYADIDRALAIMQVALEMIESVDTGGDLLIGERKTRALWSTGIGLGGPAIVAAGMLLLNRIAMALVIGLGPLFILCLLFRATRPLFTKWLHYGLGTLCSLALLSVMVTLAMDMLIAVGLAFWVADLVPGGPGEGLSSMAMQQGGLGLVLTMLIVSAPPMAAVFFNGVLGQFSPYNAVGVATGQGHAPPPGSGLPPGVAPRAG